MPKRRERSRRLGIISPGTPIRFLMACTPLRTMVTIYLAKLSDEAARFRAESLFDQIESLRELRKQAKSRFLEQARKHPDYPILTSVPGFGAVRVGELLAIAITPDRFRTKRQFWPYIGLAVVTKSSSDYKEVEGRIIKLAHTI